MERDAARRGVQAGSAADDVRGDGRAPWHRHPPRPAAARQPASRRARPGRPAADLALDAAPGDHHAGGERPPGFGARAHGRHVRGRARRRWASETRSRSARKPARCSTTAWRWRPAPPCWPPSAPATEQLERLDLLVERMAEADAFEDYRRADIRFHIGVAEAARSPRLVSAMTEVQGQVSDLIALIPHPQEVLTQSNAQHGGWSRCCAAARRRGRRADARAHPGHRAHPRRAALGRSSELGGPLHELAPVGVLRAPPGVVALRLEALARRDALGDRARTEPTARRPRRRARPRPRGGIHGAALHRHAGGVGLELKQQGSRVRPPSTRRTSTGPSRDHARRRPPPARRSPRAPRAPRAPGRAPAVSPAITARALGPPPRGPEPGERRQHAHARPRPPPARRAPASAAGSGASPRSRLSHSSSAPAVNTPPSSAHSTSPVDAPGDGRQQPAAPAPAARRPRSRARTRRCRRWPWRGPARRSRRRRARPAGRRSARAAAARPARRDGAACPGRRRCPRSPAARSRGTPKMSSSAGSQSGAPELRARGGRRVGGESGAEPVAQERVDRAHAQRAAPRERARTASSCSSSQASLPAEK